VKVLYYHSPKKTEENQEKTLISTDGEEIEIRIGYVLKMIIDF